MFEDDELAKAGDLCDELAATLRTAPDAVQVTVSHPLFGERVVTGAEIAEMADGAKPEGAKPEGDTDPEEVTCPDCGKTGLKGQRGLSTHSRFCDAGEKAGESSEPASEKESENGGEWASLTDAKKAELKAEGDEKAIKDLLDGKADHVEAFGRCAAKRVSDERCEHGRNGLNAGLCVRHQKSENTEIHPSALN